jgi:hypothetical protein
MMHIIICSSSLLQKRESDQTRLALSNDTTLLV